MNFTRLLYFTCLVLFAANHVSSTKIKLLSSGNSSIIEWCTENSQGNCMVKDSLKLADSTVIGNFEYVVYVAIDGEWIGIKSDCANMTMSGFSNLSITIKQSSSPDNLLIGVTIPRISAYPCCRFSSKYNIHLEYYCVPDPIIHDNVTADIEIFMKKHRENPESQEKFKIMPENLFDNLQPLYDLDKIPANEQFWAMGENAEAGPRNAALKPVLKKHFTEIVRTAVNLFLEHNS